jgi:phospholipid/cholesterol/gamma-HCH transport system ATP-binding protein
LPLTNSEENGTAIRVRGLHKSFGSKVVLDGVDLDVQRGSSTVIIGGSGTGKSVLLKHIIGLMKPDSGSVEVEGVAINELGNREITRFRRRFGMAFQEGALFDSMTVEQNVAFPLIRQGGMDGPAIRERVEECLAEVGLSDAAKKMPAELSGGMRRRVGFARAVANQPEILLFDEPTTGLDPVTKGTIDDLIVELRENLGSTTVTITHDMDSVFRIADQVGMLYGGRIIVWAPPEELRSIDDQRLQAFISRGSLETGAGS